MCSQPGHFAEVHDVEDPETRKLICETLGKNIYEDSDPAQILPMWQPTNKRAAPWSNQDHLGSKQTRLTLELTSNKQTNREFDDLYVNGSASFT